MGSLTSSPQHNNIMRSWKEDFGSFYTNAAEWNSRKEIHIGYSDDMSGEDMVKTAIRLAKKYNCKIIDKVNFTPGMVTGTVSFVVECHSLTYRYFYEGGKTTKLHSSEVKERDIQKYEEQFGTRTCADESFKKRYWFTDKWNGDTLTFPSLRKAKAAAKKQTGSVCYIYENFPYGRHSKIACKAPASGATPA